MDFSRRAVLEQRPLDLLPLLEQEISLLKRTLPENIKINLACDDQAYMVNADPTRLQQALMNLAVNARDVMPEGGELRFELECVCVQAGQKTLSGELEDGEWVCLRVLDTGTGISDEVMPYIFEPFFTTKAPDKGSGLGLAQVYGIVRQHDGHIHAASQLGQGATFSIYLPILSLTKPPDTLQLGPDLPQGRGETILVVEDDAVTRQALVRSLQALNYQVLEAVNGRDALDVLDCNQGQIVLILTDWVMPDMGGKALLQALQARGAAPKVVVMTGHPMQDEDLGLAGAKGWLQKPIDLDQLARVMARVIRMI